MQSIPVTRDGRDTKGSRAALRRLKAGELVGVFPEGGIGEGDELGAANPGIAWLALRSRAPVYPVYIHNAPRGAHMAAAFYTFSRVRVTYGNPIDLSEFYGRKLSGSILQETTEKLMAELARLGRHGEPEASCDNGL